MMKSFQKNIYFLLLIPLFFVQHGVLKNIGFIPFKDALILLLTYWVASAILFLIFYSLLKSYTKSALAASLVLCVFLFFGAIQDFMKITTGFLHRYSLLLPLLAIAVIICIILLKKTSRNLKNLVLFLNLLLSIYIVIDAVSIIKKIISPASAPISVTSPLGNLFTYTGENKPDIYFLLFDEYSGSASLREHYNYDNSDLDSFLIHKRFSIQKISKSNYNFTPFSMASILNMNYLSGIDDPTAIQLDDYNECYALIKNSEVVRFLDYQGYDIRNFSVFDLDKYPSNIEQTFLPLKTKLITAGTLFQRMQKDLGWMLASSKLPFLGDEGLFKDLKNNDRLIANVINESKQLQSTPRFVYMHVYMPHLPYYYDKSGKLKDKETIYSEKQSKPVQGYLDYLPYTNSRIRELVNAIQKNTNGNAVIIIMSDHGLRKDLSGNDKSHLFQIQNAVFFPTQHYAPLYDSISGVNQFRVIFNSLFQQQLPLLNDSTTYLKDNQE